MPNAENLAGDVLPTVFIDDRAYEGAGASMTGAQLLALAGLPPDDYDLYASGHHGRRIGAEDAVPVRDGARFVTRPHAAWPHDDEADEA